MNSSKPTSFAAYASIVAIYVLLVWCTSFEYAGDSTYYAYDVARFDSGMPGADRRLWEFGHVYWRPLGWVLLRWFGWLTPYEARGEEMLAATTLFNAVSLGSGLIVAVLYYWLVSRLLQQRWKAMLAAVGLLSFAAFLNYVHVGTPYIAGLMGLLGAVCVTVQAVERDRLSRWNALAAGACFALSVLVWFLYILALPGLLATALLWKKSGPASRGDRYRFVVSVTAIAAIICGIGYMIAIQRLNLHSLDDLRAWVARAGHGWSQNRQTIRLATGLPRSFLYAGNDGIVLKRFVLRDPYAPVDLATLSGLFARLAAFYLFAQLLLWNLFRTAEGRRILAICAAAAIPVLFFALVLFETGSQERYMPLYPFVALALAQALSGPRDRATGSLILAAAFSLVIPVNLYGYWSTRIEARMAPDVARIRSVRDHVSPQGMVAVSTLRDGVDQFTNGRPLHPLNRTHPLPVYNVVKIANLRVLAWREEFASRALDTLRRSESVWVSKRLLAERPDPAWGWTEGDDSRVSWRDLPPFFGQLSYSETVGGTDGFLRLEASEENMRKLELLSKERAPTRPSGE